MLEGVKPETSTWTALSRWAKEQIEAARSRLEYPRDNADQIADQSRCLVLRELLQLGEYDVKPTEPEAVPFDAR